MSHLSSFALSPGSMPSEILEAIHELSAADNTRPLADIIQGITTCVAELEVRITPAPVETPSYFADELRTLRKLLADVGERPSLADTTPEEARAFSVPFDRFFNEFFGRYDLWKSANVQVVGALNTDDVHVRIPVLRDAYKNFVSGWIPRLSQFVNALPKSTTILFR